MGGNGFNSYLSPAMDSFSESVAGKLKATVGNGFFARLERL